MPDVHGVALWPGAIAIEEATYTVSHGISPATASFKMAPQPNFPDQDGNLVFTDNFNTVTIPNCRLVSVKADRDDRGLYWQCSAVDRRWKWRDLGEISGFYNQLDPHGNLIPYTIRSPTELAVLCLTKMGETNYTLQLPDGLAYPGPYTLSLIKPSGVNPAINWDGVPPAQALQQVADLFGCRVVYQLDTDTIGLFRVGQGAELPDTGVSIHKDAPSIIAPEVPDGIGIRGAPTRYQMALRLIPVGEDYDGSYRPINLLTYAPLMAGKVKISTVTITTPASGAIAVGTTFNVTINGVPFNYVSILGDTGASVASALVPLINAAINTLLWGGPLLTASAVGGVITLTGRVIDRSFDVSTRKTNGVTPSVATIIAVETQAPTPTGVNWEYAFPPDFAASPTGAFIAQANPAGVSVTGVHATPQLTYLEAQKLAQKTVWKYYQVAPFDASGEGKPINVPGYGTINLRQQLILQDTQVDQITPQPTDNNLKDGSGRPVTVDFYSGWSKDKPAAVFGSVYVQRNGNVWYQNAVNEINTADLARVFTPFTIDPIWQLVKFSDFVYKYDAAGARIIPPTLYLKTAVLVRHNDDNQIDRFELLAPLPGNPTGTAPKIETHEDVQVNITAEYDANLNITSVNILEQDPIVRANYYLQGLALQYQLKGATSRTYNGIVPIALDGAIAQVTWSVGGGGCSTTASRNLEHDTWVPSYPARRRAEFLAPAQQDRIDQVNGRGRIPGVPGVGNG